jgi:hypothetical protein
MSTCGCPRNCNAAIHVRYQEEPNPEPQPKAAGIAPAAPVDFTDYWSATFVGASVPRFRNTRIDPLRGENDVV